MCKEPARSRREKKNRKLKSEFCVYSIMIQHCIYYLWLYSLGDYVPKLTFSDPPSYLLWRGSQCCFVCFINLKSRAKGMLGYFNERKTIFSWQSKECWFERDSYKFLWPAARCVHGRRHVHLSLTVTALCSVVILCLFEGNVFS